jgi:hypothetical protein
MAFTFVSASGETITVEDNDGVYVFNEYHAEEAVSHLIELFKRGPRNQAALGVFGVQLAELEIAAADNIMNFFIDTATGDQLDILGRIVGEPRLGRTDENYRPAVRVRILVNNSDGRAEQLLAIARGMVPGASVNLYELFPMTLRIEFSTLGATTLATVFNMLQQAKAGGVRLLVSYAPGEVGAVDGDPAGGVIGGTAGTPSGFTISGGT